MNISHVIYDILHMPLLNHVDIDLDIYDIKDSKKFHMYFRFFTCCRQLVNPWSFFSHGFFRWLFFIWFFSHGFKKYHFHMVFHMPNWMSENKLLISHSKSWIHMHVNNWVLTWFYFWNKLSHAWTVFTYISCAFHMFASGIYSAK